MLSEAKARTPARRGAAWLLAILGPLLLPGCYYLHVAAGQLDLNARREPIEEVIERPGTDAALKERLELIGRVRRFAIDELGLPDNGSYTSYAELGRQYVAWNVFAAPEFDVAPVQWCFPVAGCVAYRGYFDEQKARKYAAGRAARGEDVYVTPVAAYSTLGHFEDPVLSSMLAYDELTQAALIFHELAHQAVYAPDDSSFNEAFATVVELEGARRWVEATGRQDDLAAFLERRRRLLEVAELMVATRGRLAEIYRTGEPGPALAAAKAREFERLRSDYAALAASWQGGPGMGALLEGELNNARLAAVATYQECVPGLTRLLERLGGDLRAFYVEAARLAELDVAERRRLACEG